MRALRAERGEMSLTGLLVAIILMTGVTGATLTTFESFADQRTDLEDRNATQDVARTALDRLARELRNLASPTPDQPQAFDLAGPLEIVFKTVDAVGPNTGLNVANIKRVRYCIDTSDTTGGALVAQTQTWTTQVPPPAPSGTACPAAGWNVTETLARGIVNARPDPDRPMFTMNSAVLTDISSIHADLWVDGDGVGGVAETQISSGVFLRNQNRRPVAVFSAASTAQGIVLNGSASSDPEGEPLTYVWYDGAEKVGEGITYTYAVAPGSSHTIQLKVYDPAVLEGVADPQVVIG